MDKPTIPNFKTEAEEADWWYENRDWLTAEFVRASEEGRLRRGSTVLRRVREANSLTVPLSPEELARIHELAVQHGMEDAMYARELLQKALEQQ